MADEQDYAARIAALEELLKSVTVENTVLKNAVANLSSRLDKAEKTRPAGRSPVKRMPSSNARRPQTAGGYSVETLPRNFGKRSPARRTPSKSSRDDGTLKKRPGSSAKKRPGLAKVFQPASKSPEKKVKDDDIPADRKGMYNIGSRNIPYVVPEEFAGKHSDYKGASPEKELKLEYVYGYNGKEARDNLFFNAANPEEVIYSVAGTGVVYNPTTNTQRFFTEHNEDILCLAVHPSEPLAATGQLDPKGAHTPYICIWDTNTLEVKKRIIFHDRGCVSVAFSADGKYLITIGNDDNHELAVWDWANTKDANADGSKSKPLTAQNSGKERVFSSRFMPAADEAKEGDYSFVTIGVGHIKVWTAVDMHQKSRTLTFKKVTLRSKYKDVVKAYHSVDFLADGSFIAGTQHGDVFLFKGTSLEKVIKAHESICGAVKVTPDGGFISVGDDNKLKVFDSDFKETKSIDLGQHSVTGKAQIRSLSFHEGRVVLGLKSNGIIEVNLETQESKLLQEGHFSEIWALATHPTDHVVVTGAHDRKLRLWNYDTHSAVSYKVLGAKVRAASFSPDGSHLAVTTWTGEVNLFSYPDMESKHSSKIASETIDAVQFSPDSSLLACGSWDQAIYILSVPECSVLHTLKGHTSSVLMLDFSADGKHLMSNSRDYEILYWDVVKGRRIRKNKDVMDTVWAGWHCFLGWPVKGIWEDCNDGTDINAVDRSPTGDLLAAGDDFGLVRLYNYPVLQKNQPKKDYRGHSSHIPCVRFSNDGAHLFSAGGADCGVFQWKVE